MSFHIVIVEPEIPQNTGNIVRTTAATGADLHLIRPLGFETDDKHFKRAGLDYFDKSKLFFYDNIEELFEKHPNARFFFFTTKGKKVYSDEHFQDEDFLVFGKESAGLPEPLLEANYERALRIPMIGEIRSLNLSNAVALALYEALRQTGFEGFNVEGNLTGRGY